MHGFLYLNGKKLIPWSIISKHSLELKKLNNVVTVVKFAINNPINLYNLDSDS